MQIVSLACGRPMSQDMLSNAQCSMFENIIVSRNRCGHCQSLAPEWKKAATALKVEFETLKFRIPPPSPP